MGWAYCGTDDLGRDIGYGVVATCDLVGCAKDIDRGLSYVCGGMHGGDEYGCGRYFCAEHLYYAMRDDRAIQLCLRCATKLQLRMHRARPWVAGEMMKFRTRLIMNPSDARLSARGRVPMGLYGKVLFYSFGAP